MSLNNFRIHLLSFILLMNSCASKIESEESNVATMIDSIKVRYKIPSHCHEQIIYDKGKLLWSKSKLQYPIPDNSHDSDPYIFYLPLSEKCVGGSKFIGIDPKDKSTIFEIGAGK